jgi:hypothetical protein
MMDNPPRGSLSDQGIIRRGCSGFQPSTRKQGIRAHFNCHLLRMDLPCLPLPIPWELGSKHGAC